MSNGSHIHDVLDYGYIIASEPELGSILTWNGSAIFLWWNPIASNSGETLWSNDDIKTVYEVTTIHEAERIAKGWIEEVWKDIEDDSEDED